ncbi:MAG: pyridoxal phosphate-dependent aminotransferase [Rikenellaceae bacterium]|nr:pyridoxal phosphate-dependent aminotransferase [Rikenellaceae bacterium]
MVTLSEKARIMPASPIRKLVPFAEEAKKRGVKVYHLNIGQPDIETPREALDAIASMREPIIYYTHSAGKESYRRGLADYYNGLGIPPVSYEDIMVTTGGSEAIVFAFMACLDPGDEVLIPEPFYANYNGFAVETGVKIVTVKSTIDNDFALPPISAMEQAVTGRTRAILICNPNNPTGYLYGEEEIRELGRMAARHDMFLIVDEVYREFCYDGARHFSALNLTEQADNVVMIDSISKRYSMCGARMGALVTRNRAIIDAALRLGQARLCPPFVAQVAAEAALRTPQSYFDKVKEEYTRRRNLLVEGLNKIEGVRCPMPRGAFYAIAELPVDNAEEFARWMLEKFSFEGATVMLAPASGFYADGKSGANQVRLAYVLNEDDLRKAVRCLEMGLKEYNGR